MAVAFEESWESLELEDHSTLSLTKMANDVTYRRLLRSLERIASMNSQLLTNILLGIRQRGILYTKEKPWKEKSRYILVMFSFTG